MTVAEKDIPLRLSIRIDTVADLAAFWICANNGGVNPYRFESLSKDLKARIYELIEEAR